MESSENAVKMPEPEKEPILEGKDEDKSFMAKCTCWGKTWFSIIAIFSWIVLIGLIALGAYCGILWKTSESDYDSAKKENTNIMDQYREVNRTIQNLRIEIQNKENDLNSEKSTLQKLKEEQQNLSNSLHEKEVEFGNLKEKLQSTIHERDNYKTENAKLVEKNKKTQEEIQTLEKQVTEMAHEVKQSAEESGVFRISTYVVGAAVLAGAADNIWTHVALSSVNSQLAKIKQYQYGFTRLCEAFENYQILKWKYHYDIKRETCFSGIIRDDLKHCNDKGPTITTITTTDGYKFGAVLYTKWTDVNGHYKDPKAFTFSSILGLTAPIKTDATAFIVDSNKLIEFGDGDISVDIHGSTGTVSQKSYNIPHPYTNVTFYYNGTTFGVQNIHIDAVTI